MIKYLIGLKEECPQWLNDHHVGQHIDIQKVLQERILYYPGSGYDGQPIKTLNSCQVVHVFLYVDYLITRKNIATDLSHNGFKGYHLLDTIDINEKDLTPYGWHPHIATLGDTCFKHTESYCFMNIYERDANYDESQGSNRFAVVFLYADGHATYDALFANSNQIKAPFVVVLQDHGFGGNYSPFGRGGLMHQIATKTNVFPDYLLVATNTSCWYQYHQVSIESVKGGMFQNERHLYQHDKERKANSL